MNTNLELLDLRYKQTIIYLKHNIGIPVYKKKAFSSINKILGPQYKWLNKSVEQYFTDDVIKEAQIAIKILNFTGKESFFMIKKNYLGLCKIFHPDKGGHKDAFNILNNAYVVFKKAYEKESTNSRT